MSVAKITSFKLGQNRKMVSLCWLSAELIEPGKRNCTTIT